MYNKTLLQNFIANLQHIQFLDIRLKCLKTIYHQVHKLQPLHAGDVRYLYKSIIQ